MSMRSSSQPPRPVTPRALERLLMKAQEVAYRFSHTVCGGPSDAEDVMQDALVKTFRYVKRIRDPHAFRTWLYRTVRNACLMKRRRSRASRNSRCRSTVCCPATETPALSTSLSMAIAPRRSQSMPRFVGA